MADFFSTEKSLQLTLGRCVTFLHFCATYGCGLCVVRLGGSGCSTDSVTSGTSAEEDDLVSRIGCQSLYGTSWCGTHDSTDLHTLCNVIRMVNLFDITGCQSDLVTVGAVSSCCLTHDLLLWQLAFDRIFNRNGRISCTGHTHCLIYIRTSGQWIADGSAETGCCATEWLDLGRVVMCLILEVDKPFLPNNGMRSILSIRCWRLPLSVTDARWHFRIVYFYRNNDGTCIDLIGLFLIVQLALCFQLLHRK